PLEAVHAALDDVAAPIAGPVKLLPPPFFVALVGDYRFNAAFLQPVPNPAGRVSFVPGHFLRLLWPSGGFLQQRHKLLGLVLLARTYGDGDGRSRAVTDQM